MSRVRRQAPAAPPVDPRRQFTHLYFDPAIKYPSLRLGVKCCLLCGACKRGDGVLTRCRGVVRVTLREDVLHA